MISLAHELFMSEHYPVTLTGKLRKLCEEKLRAATQVSTYSPAVEGPKWAKRGNKW